MGRMTPYIIFAPTTDDAIRTSLPNEIRLTLMSHKAFFYQAGLLLSVTSSIHAPSAFIFRSRRSPYSV